MLFRFTPDLQARIHLARSELLVGSRDYTAVHLRTAGAIGDSEVVERGNPLGNLLGALYCSHELGHPTVVIATHPAIRTAVAKGWFDHVKGPETPRVAFTYENGAEQHTQTVRAEGRCVGILRLRRSDWTSLVPREPLLGRFFHSAVHYAARLLQRGGSQFPSLPPTPFLSSSPPPLTNSLSSSAC